MSPYNWSISHDQPTEKRVPCSFQALKCTDTDDAVGKIKPVKADEFKPRYWETDAAAHVCNPKKRMKQDYAFKVDLG